MMRKDRGNAGKTLFEKSGFSRTHFPKTFDNNCGKILYHFKIVKSIDKIHFPWYNTHRQYSSKYFLIKSGGGTGPVKPSNLQLLLKSCKVLIPER